MIESVTPLSLLFPVSYVRESLHHSVESGGRAKGSVVCSTDFLKSKRKITLPRYRFQREIGEETSNLYIFCSTFVIMLLEYVMCFCFHN